jgi:mRNA interferase MazF
VPVRREIALARFPFTNQSGAKLRPVLILAEIPGTYHDFIVMFITSQTSQAIPGLDIILDRTHPSFPTSGLMVPSVFRVAKVASMSAALMLGTLGTLDQAVFDLAVARLIHLVETGQP